MKLRITTDFLDHNHKLMAAEGMPDSVIETPWKSLSDYQKAAKKRFNHPPYSIVKPIHNGVIITQPFAHRGLGIVYTQQTVTQIKDS